MRTGVKRRETAGPGTVILLRGGRAIDPAVPIDSEVDLLLRDGRIAALGSPLNPSGGIDRTIDVRGCWVLPGLMDPHVHFREPGFTAKETVASGSAAAAHGGYTGAICEPNTKPPTDTVESADGLMKIAAADSRVRMLTKACMTIGQDGEQPVDVAALAAHPMVAALSDDGHPLLDGRIVRDVFGKASRCGIVVSPHCEDSEKSLERCRNTPGCEFAGAAPYTNEPRFVLRDIQCAEQTGAALHISHVSTSASLDHIQSAKASGLPVTCEATPHHLLLDTDYRHKGEVPLVNPPLRDRSEVDALQAALADGLVDVIATDHAPHTAEDKASGARGLIGLECSLALVLTHFVFDGRLSLQRLVELMSINPRRIFGVEPVSIAEGFPVDITVIDPAAEWVIDSSHFLSKSRNCPYDGWRVKGRVVLTMVGGEITWER